MYGNEDDEELPELVFAADKQGLRRCFSAIRWLIKKHYGKYYTVDLVKRYGALCIIRQAENAFTYRPNDNDRDHSNWYIDHPTQVEPGDYYSENGIKIDAILTGKKMLQYFARYAQLRREDTKRPRGS